MKLTPEITNILMKADGKALASRSPEDVHVVPVSTIRIVDDKIHLVNYFFGKTLENILNEPKVSLAAWKGLEGFQIKATAEYITEGELFDDVVNWVGGFLPDRIVKGVLVLTPYKILDVSANAAQAGKVVMSDN